MLLIIDDDPVVCELISRSLADTGLRFEMAADGEEGLCLARALRPDLITLDVLLPNMDGWTVLSELKADPNLAHIPVVVVTILDDQNTGFALGAAGYVTKPIDIEQVVSLVGTYCHSSTINPRSVAPILVVEDDEALRDVVRRTLEHHGWNVLEAADGRTALECAQHHHPALILLDLMLPELDGIQVIEALAARPETASIPILVLTAKELAVTERERLTGSVTDILQKGTYTSRDLVDRVRTIVMRYMNDTTESKLEAVDA
jgi:CheY-like chemotaxis protein